MKTALRNTINRANAARSTGPVTPEGKRRSSMSAFRHGLTGHRMILQDHEYDAYRELSSKLNRDFAAKNEIERQLVQKIIDCHMRLNRAAAIDYSTINLTAANSEAPWTGERERTPEDIAIESIAAQARAWNLQQDSLERLGRYEGRISRQLVQYEKELGRLQATRGKQAEKFTQTTEIKPDASKLASFRK